MFSALSWSWSSKSLQLTREASDCRGGPSEPCRPGAHCITLEKLFLAEQRLHKEVKVGAVSRTSILLWSTKEDTSA